MGNTPNIRFKGFTDDWEQRKFGDVLVSLQNNTLSRADLSNESGVAKNVHYGDVLIKFGEVLDVGKEQLPMITDERVLSKYKASFLQNGDVIVADTAEDSTVGKCSEIVGLNGDIVLSGLHTIPYRPVEKFATGYLGYYLNSGAYHNQLIPLMQGIKVTSVSKSAMQDTDIVYPKSVKEQAMIGNCFQSLDHLITLHQRKCDETKKLKKFMLQKMFPKKDEKKPEIRFADFTDDWEQRKLGWLVDNDVIEAPKDGNHGEKHPTSDEYVEEGIPFLMASDIRNGRVDLENCKYITKERAEQLDKGFAREGDVLLTHKATIGEVAILEGLQEEYAMLTPQVTYYRILDNKRLSQKYLYAVFHSESFQNEMQTKAAQSTRPYIGISAQQNLTISLPCSTEEQQRIGEYFASLDTLITLHQRKCDEIKEIKKFMLQNMFPQKG
ncbi:restriction endonuclease subunit S [Lachnospira eligens]|uniref:restriction endonuclease subunit S n=1 Tax=Lachnospira eligens TaxID=39485 RepID=UPI000E48B59E|nr:restriction endonuclease subunit S [Lachnospira eligens]RGT55374.1 restriction endonuclease subunit S [Lachnospira eligens]